MEQKKSNRIFAIFECNLEEQQFDLFVMYHLDAKHPSYIKFQKEKIDLKNLLRQNIWIFSCVKDDIPKVEFQVQFRWYCEQKEKYHEFYEKEEKIYLKNESVYLFQMDILAKEKWFYPTCKSIKDPVESLLIFSKYHMKQNEDNRLNKLLKRFENFYAHEEASTSPFIPQIFDVYCTWLSKPSSPKLILNLICLLKFINIAKLEERNLNFFLKIDAHITELEEKFFSQINPENSTLNLFFLDGGEKMFKFLHNNNEDAFNHLLTCFLEAEKKHDNKLLSNFCQNISDRFALEGRISLSIYSKLSNFWDLGSHPIPIFCLFTNIYKSANDFDLFLKFNENQTQKKYPFAKTRVIDHENNVIWLLYINYGKEYPYNIEYTSYYKSPCTYEDKKQRKIQEKQFLFDLDIKTKIGWTENHPYFYLLAFGNYFISKKHYDLFRKFINEFSKLYLVDDYEDSYGLDLVLKQLNILHDQSFHITVQNLLVLLGLLPQNGKLYLKKWINSETIVFKLMNYFKGNYLDQIMNFRTSDLREKKLFCRGIGIILYLDHFIEYQKTEKNSFLKSLYLLKKFQDFYEEILQIVVELFSSAEVPQNEAIYKFLKKESLIFPDLKVKLLPLSSSLIEKLENYLEYLQNKVISQGTYSSPKMKEIINTKIVPYSKGQQLNIENIKNILLIFRGKHNQIKHIFLQSDMRKSMEEYLMKNEQKYRKEIITELFPIPEFDEIFQKYNRVEKLNTWLNNATSIELNLKMCLALFQIFCSLNSGQKSYLEEKLIMKISNFEQGLKLMCELSKENLKIEFKKFWREMYKKKQRNVKKFLSLAEDIPTDNKEFLTSFEYFAAEEIIEKGKTNIENGSKSNVYEILKELKKENKNPSYRRLIDQCLQHIPDPDSIGMVDFFTKPISTSDPWYILLIDTKKQNEKRQKLIYEIEVFIKNLKKKNISMKKGELLFHLSKEDRKILIQVLSVVNKNSPNILNEIIQKIERELKNYENLTNFLQVYGQYFDSKDIIYDLKNIYQNFEDYTIENFYFSDHLTAFIDLSKDLNQLCHSKTFHDVYIKRKLHLRKNMNYEEFKQLLAATLREFKTEIGNILRKISQAPLNSVLNNFNFIEKSRNPKEEAKNEIGILQKFFHFQDPAIVLNINKVFKFLAKKTDILCFIDTMLKISEILHFDLNSWKKLKIDYQKIATLKCSVDQFVQVSEYTCKELYSNLKKHEVQDFSNLMKAIADSKEIKEFVIELSEEIIINMKDSVNDFDDTEEAAKSVQSLSEIQSFFENIRDPKSVSDLKMQIKKIWRTNKFKNIAFLLKEATSQITIIKDLYLKLTNNEEAKKKQMENILQNSSFRYKIEKKKWRMIVTYKIQEANKTKELTHKDVIELKERAILIVNTVENQKNEEEEFLRKFIELIELSHSIFSTLKNLDNYGYPIQTIPKLIFDCKNSHFEEIIEIQNQFYNLFNNWKETIKDKNLSNSFSYLFGKQWLILEDYFTSKNNSPEAIALLIFLNKNYSKIPNKEKLRIGEPAERLRQLLLFLDSIPSIVRKKNSRNPENIGKALILESPKMSEAIITLYKNDIIGRMVPNIIMLSQILFCSFNTSWLEIKSFVLRCFLNEIDDLFIIVYPDKLSTELQDKFEKLVKKLHQEEFNQNKFRLGILLSEHQTNISHFFQFESYSKPISSHLIISEQEATEMITKFDNSMSTVITSEQAGLGKTTYAVVQAKKLKKDLKRLLISGEINLQEIGEDLLNIGINEESILLLQIDCVENKNDKLLEKILFQLIYCKGFNFSNGHFYLPKGAKLYIELSNQVASNCKRVMSLLKGIQKIQIENFKKERIFTKTPEIQHICQYLYYLENNQMEYFNIIDSKNKNVQMPHELCVKLLEKYFVKEHKEISYSQLNVFIKVLDHEFKGFQNSPFIPVVLQEWKNFNTLELDSIFSSVRTTMVQEIIRTTNKFSVRSVGNVKAMQNRTVEQLRFKDEIEEWKFDMDNFSSEIIKWENKNHFFLIMNEDGECVPIYKDYESIPQNFRKFLRFYMNFFKVMKNNTNQGNIDRNKIVAELQQKINNPESIFNYSTSKESKLKMILKNFNPNYQSNKKQDYVVTTDNFLKMMLIYTRVRAKIPVVIVGETGCGKTSLIRYLSNEIFQEEMWTINIHAGITKKKLLEEMKNVIEEAKCMERKKKQLWVFFDEFNTSEVVGTINDIVCHRKLQNYNLPNNLVFVAACNPYRMKSKSVSSFGENVGIRKEKNKSDEYKLLYTVRPLPETMLDYVWDFGSLVENDEKKYIEAILKYNINGETSMPDENRNKLISLIFKSHRYFKNFEDVSSVSLRDVQRFKLLFKFFRKSLELKNPKYKSNIKHSFEYRAAILALIHCYYLRLGKNEDRMNYFNVIGIGVENSKQFLQILDEEQLDIIKRMKNIPPGIANNKSLKENVLAILACIMTDIPIPIFICGKPGCSKTLAINLIQSNLRERHSKDPYFQKLPQIQMVFFQGSENSTSKAVLHAFSKAKSNYKNISDIKPVIVFDEIGLAELSQHNPLKVLHNELEMEKLQETKIGFVGISNWRLDASKMNRALYLARPDPDLEELIYTAKCIYNSIADSSDIIQEKIMEALSHSYFYLKQNLVGTYSDFYGLRDFYNLIKITAIEFKNQKCDDIISIMMIVKKTIERNFGGGQVIGIDVVQIMEDQFLKNYGYNSSFIEIPRNPPSFLIEDNLSSPDSRYLMIISEGDEGSFILENMAEFKGNKYIQIIGSYFEEDKDDYGLKSLSDIISYMEKGQSIILKNMDHIYSSLYDLFNQSFSRIGGKKYCRIAFGALYNPKCLVDENFHCIIYLDSNAVCTTDAPFLNRFEKHCLRINDVLKERQKNMVENVRNWMKSLTEIGNNSQKRIPINRIFPYFHSGSLSFLILQNSQEDLQEEEIEMNTKIQLIKEASSDFLVANQMCNLNDEEKDNAYNYYLMTHQASLEDIINENSQQNSIVLTFSKQIPHQIRARENIYCKILENYKKEEDLRNDFKYFFKEKNASTFIMEIDLLNDWKNLSFVKGQIDKYMPSDKKMILILQVSRNQLLPSDYQPTYFIGWNSFFIDDIGKEVIVACDKQITIDDILEMDTYELLTSKDNRLENFINLENELELLIERTFLTFKYNIHQNVIKEKSSVNQYVREICKKIAEDSQMRDLLRKKIEANLENRRQFLDDWKLKMLFNENIISITRSPLEAGRQALILQIQNILTNVIFNIESRSAFPSYWNVNNAKEIKEIWTTILQERVSLARNFLLSNVLQSIQIPFGYHLEFPFSHLEYEFLERLFEEYQKNEGLIATKTKYLDGTLLKENMEKMKTNKYLQKLYVADIIQLFILKNYFSEELISPMVELMVESFELNQDDDFIKFILYFISHQDQILQISYFIRNMKYILLSMNEGIISTKVKEVKNFLRKNQKEKKGINAENILLQTVNEMLLIAIPRGDSIEKGDYSLNELNLYFKNLLINIQQLIKTYTIDEDEDENENDALNSNIEKIQLVKYLIEIISQIEPKEQHPKLLNALENAFSQGQQSDFFNSNHPFQKFIENYIDDLNKQKVQEKKCIYELISFRIAKQIGKSANNLKKCFKTLQSYKIIDKISTRFGYSIFQYLIFQEEQSDVKPNDFELLPDEYGFIENIEQCLEDETISHQFGCFLNDFVQKIFYLQLKPYDYREFEKNKERFLRDYTIKFSMYFQVATNNLISKFKLTKLALSKAFLSYYLKLFCEQIVLYKNSKGSEPYFSEISQIIEKEENLSNEMLKYCGVYLRDHLQMTDNQFNKWIKDYSDRLPFLEKLYVETEKALSYFPISTSEIMANWFIKCLEILSKIAYTPISPAIEKILQEASKSYEKKFNFLLAFIIQVYILHSSARKNYSLFQRWIKQSQNLIEETIGREEFDFMDFLLNKSNASGFLHLKESSLESVLHKKIMIASFIALMICSRRNTNCLTYIYFENGTYRTNLADTINRHYIIAANKDMILESNINLHIALKSMAPTESATLHKCSATCDYLFMANECGWPTDKNLRCPFDNADLTAPGHQWTRKINPPITLSPKQGRYFYGKAGDSAKLALQQIELGKQKQPRGFGTLENILSEKDERFREMDIVPFKILRILNFSFLNYLLEIRKIQENDVFQFLQTKDGSINYNKAFSDLIEYDIKCLSQILNGSDLYKWIYTLFPSILDFLLTNTFPPTTPTNRDSFEKEFNQIISKFTRSFEKTIDNYQKRFEKINGKIKWSNFLEKTNYFRNIKLATETNLLNSSILAKKGSKRESIMNLLYLSQNLSQVQYLWPIFEFSQYMLNKFNYSITRCEAYENEIKYYLVSDPTMNSLFKKFCEAWKSSNFGEVVQFDCKVLKNPKIISDDMTIANFLIDSANDGCGSVLLGGIITLVKSHNSLISAFAEEYAKKMGIEKEAVLGKKKVFLNSISRKDCIQKALQIEKIATKYYINDLKNPQIISMDWKTIENKIIELYLNKKVIDDNPENIQTIKYQGEQFSSSIFNDITTKIHQSSLTQTMQKQILYSHIFQAKSQIQGNLKQILGSFERIFCFLANEKLTENTLIQEVLKTFDLSNISPFLQKEPLSNLELKYIIDIFEFFEKEYFMRIKNNIPSFDILPEKIDQNITTKVVQLSKMIEREEFPSFQEVQNALIKFFMRSNIQNLKQDDLLIRYLNRRDLWKEKWDLYFHIYNNFGEEIMVSNFYEFYFEIDQRIQGHNSNIEGSSRASSPFQKKGMNNQQDNKRFQIKKPGKIKV